MLSVVIATANSERALVPTLAPLVSGAAAGIVRDVVVVDAGSQDRTADVADHAGCQLIVSDAGLAQRLRQGAASARGPWLLFLRPGTVLEGGWIEDVVRFVERVERDGVERAAVFRPAAATGERPAWREALALLRLSLGGSAKAGQGLLLTRKTYDRLGGHRDGVADPERDLARRLGRRAVMLRSAAVVLD